MTQRPSLDDLRQLGASVAESPAFAIVERQRSLGTAYRIWEGNAKELIELLDAVSQDQIPAEWHSQANMGRLLMYVTRLLQNFLAAAMALVEHSRKYAADHYRSDPDVLAEYDRIRIERFTDSPHEFVQKLRNFMLKEHHPGVQYLLRASRGQVTEIFIYLDTNEMKQWSGWGKTRPYLESLGPETPVIDLVREYRDVVREHYLWLIGWERSRHSADFEEYDRRLDALKAAARLAGIPLDGLDAMTQGLLGVPPAWLPDCRDREFGRSP